MPVTTVLRLSEPATTTADFCDTGAAASTPGTCALIAATSRASKARTSAREPPGPPCPGRAKSRLLPRLPSSSVTRAVAPLPIVTMAITAATPMTMPSTVRKERTALRVIAMTASFRVSASIRRPPSGSRPRPCRP